MKACNLVASAILCVIPVFGHHYSLAEFDASRTVRISGTISKVEFSNPHVTFSVDVKNSDGTVTHWKVGTASPNVLIRGGITKASLAEGTTIVVDAYPAKDGSPRANVRNLTLADGRQLITRDPSQNCDREPFPENCIKVQAPVK